MKSFSTLLLLVCCFTASVGEVIPPAPKQYFNDYANVVSPATAASLKKKLEDFERETPNQILVTVFPKMQSDSSIEDYTVRVAQSWKVGQKGKNNGAVLFVFIQDRKMYLQVGYGLEGALPDALGKRIIEDEIKPHFKNGDFDGGLSAGVSAILAAAKGEYKGTGRTVADHTPIHSPAPDLFSFFPFFIVAAIFVLFVFLSWKVRSHGGNWHGWTISSGGFSGGGWSGGGGGFSSGGGGGFSGGGGSFGGGGAGGSW
ncbi:MAG: TPM domain-containing protein [Verrucomicrobia bacterium]|nr:TPM domain-containing protein [Verrucomicrobiota bacterium]